MRQVKSQVKITVANTCGSGTVVYQDDDKCLILTNAHVVGTQIGRQVSVWSYFRDGRHESRQTGVVTFAAFRRGQSIDLAVVETQPIPEAVAIPIADNGRCNNARHWTGGSPRCEDTKFSQVFFTRQDSGDSIYYWLPNAIGGQSGSGVLSQEKNLLTALLTWSNGTEGMGQSSAVVYDVLTQRRTSMSAPLPANAIPACENPQPCDDGISGELAVWPPGMFGKCGDPTDPADPPGDDNLVQIVAHAESIILLASAEAGETLAGRGVDIDWLKLGLFLLEAFLEYLRNNQPGEN